MSDNVVKMKPRRKTEGPIKKKPFDVRRCQHGYYEVDDELRRVTCQSCKEILDPVQVMIDLSWDWTRHENNYQWMKNEAARYQKQVQELIRERDNLKAQIRRAKWKDADPEPAQRPTKQEKP